MKGSIEDGNVGNVLEQRADGLDASQVVRIVTECGGVIKRQAQIGQVKQER